MSLMTCRLLALAVAIGATPFGLMGAPGGGNATQATAPLARELRITFEGTRSVWDIITVEAGKVATLTATITNVSQETIRVIGTGSTPIVLAPSDHKLGPGEAMSVSVLVTPSFAAYPVSVTIGVVYRLENSDRLLFSSARARVAPKGAVVAQVDRVVWAPNETDEREIKLQLPANTTLKDAKVQGPFAVRLQGGAVLVRPLAQTQSLTSEANGGEASGPTGSIQLVVDPKPAFRVAPIALAIQVVRPGPHAIVNAGNPTNAR